MLPPGHTSGHPLGAPRRGAAISRTNSQSLKTQPRCCAYAHAPEGLVCSSFRVYPHVRPLPANQRVELPPELCSNCMPKAPLAYVAEGGVLMRTPSSQELAREVSNASLPGLRPMPCSRHPHMRQAVLPILGDDERSRSHLRELAANGSCFSKRASSCTSFAQTPHAAQTYRSTLRAPRMPPRPQCHASG